MGSRLRLARVGAAVVGVSVAMALSALPAGAEDTTAKLDRSSDVEGLPVKLDNGNQLQTHLLGLELADGAKLKAYCVDIRTPIDRNHPDMVERPWDGHPKPDSPFHQNRDKINWILHHSYPATELEALKKTLTDAGETIEGDLSVKEAIAGTQAAVWHFSDGVDLGDDNAADVLALYGYLTGDANEGIGEQPLPALEISPEDKAGQAGELIGPFTVSTTAELVELTRDVPDGVKLTDKDGKELAAADIKNGTEVYFQVPADAEEGEGTFGLGVTAPVDTGRLFVGAKNDKHPTQGLIVAQAENSELTAEVKASWTAGTTTTTTITTTTTATTAPTTTTEAAPVPQARNTGGLATTGASIFVPVAIGLVLVGAGVGALLFQRRRKRA
jgi:TQXA domain-containing protein